MRSSHGFILLVLALSICPLSYADDLLYRFSGWHIKDGKSGPIVLFQKKLNEKIRECNTGNQITPDGVFGRETREAIINVVECENISSNLDSDSLSRKGAITIDLWNTIVPDTKAPDVHKRAASLTLTFEGTDYDHMQWNFCQNRPLYKPELGRDICYSNDRRSFITWGPNGATAGHGREAQAILSQFLKQEDTNNKKVFYDAFSSESTAVRRMLELENSKDNSALEIYLCGIWMNREKRAAWIAGFKSFGKNDSVKETYRRVYQSKSFDGGKISTFYKVWQSEEFGLVVTEIDHAYFVDRSAHMSISENKLRNALLALKQEAGDKWPVSPAEIRQYVSLKVTPSNQRQDRLGRDVAYYVGGVGIGRLSHKERKAWKERGSRDVLDVGLSDERQLLAFTAGAVINNQMPRGKITEEEKALCPVAVLNPRKP